jgi:hypothetical protein
MEWREKIRDTTVSVEVEHVVHTFCSAHLYFCSVVHTIAQCYLDTLAQFYLQTLTQFNFVYKGGLVTTKNKYRNLVCK